MAIYRCCRASTARHRLRPLPPTSADLTAESGTTRSVPRTVTCWPQHLTWTSLTMIWRKTRIRTWNAWMRMRMVMGAVVRGVGGAGRVYCGMVTPVARICWTTALTAMDLVATRQCLLVAKGIRERAQDIGKALTVWPRHRVPTKCSLTRTKRIMVCWRSRHRTYWPFWVPNPPSCRCPRHWLTPRTLPGSACPAAPRWPMFMVIVHWPRCAAAPRLGPTWGHETGPWAASVAAWDTYTVPVPHCGLGTICAIACTIKLITGRMSVGDWPRSRNRCQFKSWCQLCCH